MHDWFQPAPQPVVLGYRLKPLTIGHLFLLRELESPFVIGGDKIFGDLAVVVFVCSMTHQEAQRCLRKWWARPFFALWGRVNRKRDWKPEIERLEYYLTTHFENLGVKHNPFEEVEIGTPFEWRLVSFLMAEMHQTHAAALSFCVLDAHRLYVAHFEMNGKLKLRTAQEEWLREYADQQERARQN